MQVDGVCEHAQWPYNHTLMHLTSNKMLYVNYLISVGSLTHHNIK